MAQATSLARVQAHRVADTVRMALVAGCAIALIAADAFLPALAL